MHCIRCDIELEPVTSTSENKYVQPSQGVMCSTQGNFGSTVFDPMGSTTLYFQLCDDCLMKTARLGYIRKANYVKPKPTITFELWNASGEWEED